MKDTLFPFQEKALADLHSVIDDAHLLMSSRKTQIISFSAPTGAGKTIMMTQLFEELLYGDTDHIGDPDSIIIWISDSPELNEQTRRKIETKSDRIPAKNLITLDNNFTADILECGHIYFLNTQKLGSDKLLVSTSDKRQTSIWTVIENTATQYYQKLYCVIDEAHRGTNNSEREANKAQSIMQKFLKGSPDDGLSPLPLTIGMTATPQKFDSLVLGITSSTKHQVVVIPEDVRSSGLLKDRIILRYPTIGFDADMSLFKSSVEDWKKKCLLWQEYYDQNNDDEKKLQKEKTEKITYYAQNEDGETEKVTREYVFAKNLMSLKTAKAAYHTFAIANDTLSTVNNAAYGYENARDIYRDLAEEDREIDLRLLSSWKGCRFAIAYGSYTKDKKRVTSGKNQNAYTQYVQPFIMGKSSVDGTMVKEEMWTIRQDTNTMWSATDNHDHKYANALRIPLQGSKYDFKSFFYNTSEDCKFETHGVVGGFLSLSANTFYYNAYDEDGNKDNTERQVVLFSPELCIKDNKGNTSEAVNPLGNKYEVIYRGADNEHEWNWWNSLTATERYVDGKKTDFASENK